MRTPSPACHRWAFALPLTAILAACGGGGGSDGGSPPTDTGTVQFALTDAPTDAIDLFEVDVHSLTLHGVDGRVVEALPHHARIDFADLVALSELLTSATVPSGAYDRVALTLDFTSAAVHLDGQAGDATVLDGDGNPFVGTTTVGVDFPTDRPFVVAPGVARFIELDFDLDASTTVDTVANTVSVGAVFYAHAEPSDAKPVRVYGRLDGTDAGAPTFSFERLGRRELGRGATHTAQTDERTVFEVDGTVARGAAGFDLLAAKPEGTRLEIHGVFDPATRRLLARAVEAGRGVFDGTRDAVEGLVLARLGGAGADATLVVAGLGVDRGMRPQFHRTFTVRTSLAGTRVVRRGDDASLTTDDVNVGQRIVALGDLGPLGQVLDASAPGLVRLIQTDVSGVAAGPAAGGALTLALLRIGRIPVGAFDFRVGGAPVANPAALKVGTGSLSLPGIAGGSAVRALGIFAPVTAAPTAPDFEATTVIDRSDAASLLRVRWIPPTPAPFASSAATGVTIDLTGAVLAKVDVGLVVPTDLLGGTDPRLVPSAAGGLFAVVEPGRGVTLHHDFGAWTRDIAARLARPRPAVIGGLEAGGRWDAAGRTFAARRAALWLR